MKKKWKNIDEETVYVATVLFEVDTFVVTYYNYILTFFTYLIEHVCVEDDSKEKITLFKKGFEEKHRTRFL